MVKKLVKKQVKPKRCPKGSVKKNGKCVPKVKVTCIPGKTLKNGKCVKSTKNIVISRMKNAICIEGYKISNGRCIKDKNYQIVVPTTQKAIQAFDKAYQTPQFHLDAIKVAAQQPLPVPVKQQLPVVEYETWDSPMPVKAQTQVLTPAKAMSQKQVPPQVPVQPKVEIKLPEQKNVSFGVPIKTVVNPVALPTVYENVKQAANSVVKSINLADITSAISKLRKVPAPVPKMPGAFPQNSFLTELSNAASYRKEKIPGAFPEEPMSFASVTQATKDLVFGDAAKSNTVMVQSMPGAFPEKKTEFLQIPQEVKKMTTQEPLEVHIPERKSVQSQTSPGSLSPRMQAAKERDLEIKRQNRALAARIAAVGPHVSDVNCNLLPNHPRCKKSQIYMHETL